MAESFWLGQYHYLFISLSVSLILSVSSPVSGHFHHLLLYRKFVLHLKHGLSVSKADTESVYLRVVGLEKQKKISCLWNQPQGYPTFFHALESNFQSVDHGFFIPELLEWGREYIKGGGGIIKMQILGPKPIDSPEGNVGNLYFEQDS